MPSIRFNLKQPKSKSPTAIFLIYQLTTMDRLKYYTGYKIQPDAWNKKTMRPIPCADHQVLSMLLDSIESFVKQTIIELRINKKPISAPLLKALLNDRFQIRSNLDQSKFIDYIDILIERRTAQPEFKASTIRTYKLFKSNLIKFDKNITFNNITLHWYRHFTLWMYGRGCSTNYVNNQTRKMKMFLKAALDDGIHANDSFTHKKFNTPAKKILKIYNTESEIEQMYNFNYPNRYLRNAVNLYCIGCCTGLRYSDLNQLDSHRDTVTIQGHRYLKIHTQKTNDDLIIPYNDLLIKILETQKIKSISNQKLNLWIKAAARLCGIDKKVSNITYPKGIIKKEFIEKWRLISAHTARRSFVTNMYIKGVPAQYIMRITGHKSESTFMEYLSLSNIETAVLMAKEMK